MTLLERTFALVQINSVSRQESTLADLVASELAKNDHLEVERVGDNVVARTKGGRPSRVLLVGHLDTVPGDPSRALISGDRVVGLGACDMKGSLAVMLEIAEDWITGSREVTWVFYAREEIARRESGLSELFELRPDLVRGDVAIVMEPTAGLFEAGCQGSLRVEIVLRGVRAHTARPFRGRNAAHRAGRVVSRIAEFQPRSVTLEGVTYVEQLQVVALSSGVAGNVVPDEATVVVNYRIAPDQNGAKAFEGLRTFLGDLLDEHDQVTVLDEAPPAAPNLSTPELSSLVAVVADAPRAKVGWTDVATFAEHGIPAINFGAGDPELAHHPDEFVSERELEFVADALRRWLGDA